MAVYVDPLMNHGWVLRGRATPSCHMFADTLDELHAMAEKIGMKQSWFQEGSSGLKHYDLTKSLREAAVAAGALELGRNDAVAKYRELRGKQ